MFTFTQVKEIKSDLENLDVTDFREVIENLTNDENDFEVENFRFIHSDYIDDIQKEELESDPYILGCFNSSFLEGIINLDSELIDCIQSGEQYDKLGEYLINNNFVEEIQKEYSRLDGYGHHFAHYDHNEHEIYFGEQMFYAFRVN